MVTSAEDKRMPQQVMLLLFLGWKKYPGLMYSTALAVGEVTGEQVSHSWLGAGSAAGSHVQEEQARAGQAQQDAWRVPVPSLAPPLFQPCPSAAQGILLSPLGCSSATFRAAPK